MKKKSKRRIKYIIFWIVIALVIATVLIIKQLSSRVKLNSEGTVGNTAGNINNGGYFCEYNGTVYFANPYDNNNLYSMNADETKIKRLNSSVVCNILAGGEYLYYFQLDGSSDGGMENVRTVKSFNRCNLNGQHAVGLTRDVIVSAQLVDNYLYLLAAKKSGPVFSKMKIDKSEEKVISDHNINPASVQNSTIYYNGVVQDHYLYALDTETDSYRVAYRGNLWNPIVDGTFVYFMDVDNNYRLCRYNMVNDVIEVLTNDRIDCYNMGSGYIYYQKNGTEPQLKCIRVDGTDEKVIAEGNYTHISMTSQYVYFQEFGNPYSIYHCPLGQTLYSNFDSAALAASK